MMPDSSSATDAEPVPGAGGTEGLDAPGPTAADLADGMDKAAADLAEGAEAANQAGAELASDASRVTSDAFEEMRQRLNAMAQSLPPASADALKPLGAAGDAFGTGLRASYAGALQGMAEFNSKAVAAWRSNAESTIRHWQSLAGTRSLSEAIALSAEHTRQQLEAMTAQTRELSTLASRIMRSAAGPLNRDKG